MPLQFRQFGAAGGDRQHLRPNSPRAADVERRVPDHEHFFAAQVGSENAATTIARRRRDLVAVFVFVAERARLEGVPEVKVAELDFGPEADIACEQAQQGRFGSACKLSTNSRTPGQTSVLLSFRRWSSQKT